MIQNWADLKALALLLGLAAFLGAAVANADDTDHNFYSSDGDEYAASFNEDGAVLTSIYPKAYARFEPSENHSVDRKHAVIFFGRSCDALHNELGEGRWLQANGGFYAEFERGEVGFNRQELVVPGAGCTYLPSLKDSWPGNQPDPNPATPSAGGTFP